MCCFLFLLGITCRCNITIRSLSGPISWSDVGSGRGSRYLFVLETGKWKEEEPVDAEETILASFSFSGWTGGKVEAGTSGVSGSSGMSKVSSGWNKTNVWEDFIGWNRWYGEACRSSSRTDVKLTLTGRLCCGLTVSAAVAEWMHWYCGSVTSVFAQWLAAAETFALKAALQRFKTDYNLSFTPIKQTEVTRATTTTTTGEFSCSRASAHLQETGWSCTGWEVRWPSPPGRKTPTPCRKELLPCGGSDISNQ